MKNRIKGIYNKQGENMDELNNYIAYNKNNVALVRNSELGLPARNSSSFSKSFSI
tara:strand:+ start:544 stop:708 length:165 start_codon:yes stop_codon:yes gene_type:complete